MFLDTALSPELNFLFLFFINLKDYYCYGETNLSLWSDKFMLQSNFHIEISFCKSKIYLPGSLTWLI